MREYVVGNANRKATPAELVEMQRLVGEAMKEGALGVGSALIYFPGSFADTAELTALAKAAAPFGGAYISHMRSEADRLLEGIDELVGIARAAGIHGEIYHLKAAGRDNWPKMREAIAHIEAHGSKHSEAILTRTESVARKFQAEVDAAAVYWNASTRFTDGFELGLGGELGISTQKLHVRGPVGLRELTSVRWVMDGTGQIRD